MPRFLQMSIVDVPTMDCLARALEASRYRAGGATYLDGQIEQMQVPLATRDDVLVNEGHADRRQAVGEDRGAAAALDRGEKGDGDDAGTAGAARRAIAEKCMLLAVGHAKDEVVALLVRHGGQGDAV